MVDEHDTNKDHGSVSRFWDHLRVAVDVAGASSGDPLEHHRHEGDLHEIWDIL
jgi:TolB-like protein